MILTIIPEQVVNEFWRRAVSHVVSVLRIEWSISLHAVIDAGMIPFAAYIAAETASVFQREDNPEQSSHRESRLHFIHGISCRRKSAPHLDRFDSLFAGLRNVTNTQSDSYTDHATPSVAIGCIYLLLQCGLKCVWNAQLMHLIKVVVLLPSKSGWFLNIQSFCHKCFSFDKTVEITSNVRFPIHV